MSAMDDKLVLKAVEALQQYHATLKKKRKSQLIEDEPVISLIIAFKKIPDRTIRPHRIPLPHPLHPPGELELCLLTKSDKTTSKELLESKGVKGVTKVIPIAKLKTNYKTFESKRQLSSSYDVFLTDRRIYQMLPRLLGKKFFEKKKFPYPVDLQKKALADEIQRARDATYLHLGLGSCCSVRIGRLGQPTQDIADNILAGVKAIANRVPRGFRNVQSLHLKTVDSIALPIYNSLPPQPTRLPGVGEEEAAPVVKKIRLDEDSESGSEIEETKSEEDEVGESYKNSDLAIDEDHDEESLVDDSVPPSSVTKPKRLKVSDYVDAMLKRSSLTPIMSAEIRGGVKRKVSARKLLKAGRGVTVRKLSTKKVRGSTVISSRYEKAERKRRRRTLN